MLNHWIVQIRTQRINWYNTKTNQPQECGDSGTRMSRKKNLAQTRLCSWEERLVEENLQGASARGGLPQRHSHNCESDRIATRKPIIEYCREHAYGNEVSPKRGDRAQILNPRKDQLNVGTVTSFCVDGNIKIITNNNSIVTQLKKNVYYLK